MAKDFTKNLGQHGRKKISGRTAASRKDVTETIEKRNTDVSKTSETRNTLSLDVSYLDYQMMTRLPRKMMDYFFAKHRELGVLESEPFPVDSFDMSEKLEKSSVQLRGVVKRLRVAGFIQVHESRKNGSRLISLSQGLFNSKN